MVMKNCLLKSVLILTLAAACLSAACAADNEQARDRRFGGKRSSWNGFGRCDFHCDSRKCIVVAPAGWRRCIKACNLTEDRALTSRTTNKNRQTPGVG